MAVKYENMVGKVFKTNSGTDCVIIEFNHSRDMKIKFLDKFGHEMNTYLPDLRNGKVKNPFAPAVCGVGYLGAGKYKPSVNGVKTLAYVQWHGMIRRGYSDEHKKKNPSCEKSYVCDDWHCFDTYAEWFYQQKGWDRGFHLDKDIKGDGTQKYSPETCSLVPHEVNTLLNNNSHKDNGLPLGVSVDHWSKDFLSMISKYGKLQRIGVYKTAKEAFHAYKNEREQYIKEVALHWREYLDEDVYDLLYNIEVGESGCLTKEDSAFKFYETGEVEIPEYYQDNIHLVGVERAEGLEVNYD